MELKGKKIFIFQQRKWGPHIGHHLAKKLQQEGCILGAITLKRSTHKFTTEQKDVKYEYLWSNDEIMSEPKKYLNGFDVSLEEICKSLNISTLWPSIYSLRLHVKSYKDKFYFGFKQNISDEDIVDYVKVLYKYIVDTFNKFKPDLIIAPNFVTLPHLMFYYYAKRKGIKMIGVSDSKVQGYNIFIHDPFESSGRLNDRVKELNNGLATSKNIDKARKYIQEFRKEFKKPDYAEEAVKKSLYKKIRHEFSPYRNIFKWYTKNQINYVKVYGVTPDYCPPFYILRDFYKAKAYRKAADRFSYCDLDNIEKFIYFPLQCQPEATIEVQSAFFSNQIEISRLVAMSLPDDYTLVVKEHPDMVGLRPLSYLKKIARTPNIKLIDYRISSEKVIKKCSMIISPNSTSLAEAAFYKKPGIQLGDLGITLLFPNVVKYSNMPTLSNRITEHFKSDFYNNDYEKKLENYVAAVFDVGFNFNYVGVWERNEKENLDILWKYFKTEIELT